MPQACGADNPEAIEKKKTVLTSLERRMRCSSDEEVGMAEGPDGAVSEAVQMRLQPSYAVPSLTELDLRMSRVPSPLSVSATSPPSGYRILNLRRAKATAAPKFLSA